MKICERGLEMLKVGGKLSYSTCFLNPIENEAVVAALLQKYAGKIRLLDVKLPGFKFYPGLKTWEFLIQKFTKEVERIDNENTGESYFTKFEKLDEISLEL
jgi:16S rRNA C967 or C1407 C5-methylase (RsmB/RsmF family)